MRVSRGIVIDVPCTPEHSRVRSASRKTQRISITSISAFLSIIFPLGPPFCGDECRAERALGCGGPRDQQAGATAEEAAKGRKCEGGAGNGSGRASVHDTTCDPSVSRTAVRWGPRFSSSAPPRSPAPPFDHFPFGPGPWVSHSVESVFLLTII